MRQAIVTGPTPPGDRTTTLAFWYTSSVMSPLGEPTSIATTPSLTISPVTTPARPTQLITTSPSRTLLVGSDVSHSTSTTSAPRSRRKCTNGLPICPLAPTTTNF